MKKIAISQSNYIPWVGYFDMIGRVDEFILQDDVQYTPKNWRNRNLIKTQSGQQWLTIPVNKSADNRINSTIVMPGWTKKHLKAIHVNYKKAKHFDSVYPWLEEIYTKANNLKFLSAINFLFLHEICEKLTLNTKLSYSTDYFTQEELNMMEKNEEMLKLCQKSNATDYITGPSAQVHMDLSILTKNDLPIEIMNYSDYEAYPQLFGEFIQNVTILDLLLNLGFEKSCNYMKS